MKRVWVVLVLLVVAALLAGCASIAQIEQAQAVKAQAQAAQEQARAWSTHVAESGLTERAEIRAAARSEARRDFYAVIMALTADGGSGDGAAGTDHEGGITAAVGLGVGWPTLAIAAGCLWGLVFWLRRHDRPER